MLAEGAQTQVTAARIRNARSTILARIVVAHGDLASWPDVPRGTLTLPITVVLQLEIIPFILLCPRRTIITLHARRGRLSWDYSVETLLLLVLLP